MATGPEISLAEAAAGSWDVIVIGAGMGGAAAAFALSEGQGDLRILVVDPGHLNPGRSDMVTTEVNDPAHRREAGHWPTRMTGVVDGRHRAFWAAMGTGGGGSTQLYAAALDRFRPGDFESRSLPDGRTLSWPYDYACLEPYYARAERLFRVTGTPDPLAPDISYVLADPPPLSARDAWFYDRFRNAGLHPYRLHCGTLHVPGCSGCLGRVCLRDCKQHAGNVLLEPALATGRVAFCARTEAVSIVADAQRVTGVTLRSGGPDNAGAEEVTVATRAVVLAAGAYLSPAILLRSRSDHWPRGLANHNDQVGRNLMFHAEQRLAVWARRGLSAEGPAKSITLRDFYTDGTAGPRYGELQSTGAEARYGNVLYALRQQFDQSRLARLRPLRHLLRIPAMAADKLLGGATIFALIIEDDPYPQNRVVLDPDSPTGMRFEYTIPDELRQRMKSLVRRLKTTLKGVRWIWLSPQVALNHGHPCGTCRAGTDPADSVVDANGKAHGLDNLYVACASTMPTSGGTNPSLTIAAMALRTGAALRDRLETERR